MHGASQASGRSRARAPDCLRAGAKKGQEEEEEEEEELNHVGRSADEASDRASERE